MLIAATHDTRPMNRTISLAQADEIVQMLGYDDATEDCETFEAEREFRFFLAGGLVLVIGFDGSAKMRNEDGDELARSFVDFEQVGTSRVRYWVGDKNVGTYTFSEPVSSTNLPIELVEAPIGKCYLCLAAAWERDSVGPLCPSHAAALDEYRKDHSEA